MLVYLFMQWQTIYSPCGAQQDLLQCVGRSASCCTTVYGVQVLQDECDASGSDYAALPPDAAQTWCGIFDGRLIGFESIRRDADSHSPGL